VLCRGAPKAPYPSYWGWIHVSGGGIGPSSVGGVAAWLLSRDGYAAMPFDWRGSSVGGPRTAPGRGPAAEKVLPHRLSSVGGSCGRGHLTIP